MRLFALAIFLLTLFPCEHALAGQRIVALVNDEPISAYDIDQRIKLKLAGDRQVPALLKKKIRDPSTPERFKKFVMKEKPTSKAEVEKLKGTFVRMLRGEVMRSLQSKYKKEVLDELIGERLMLQEAKKLNLLVSDDEVTEQLSKMAAGSKNAKTGKPLTTKEFLGQLKRIGVREKDFRQRVKANLSLQKVVYRKYGRQVNVGAQQIDDLIASGDAEGTQKKTEYQLQKVTFTIQDKTDQAAIARRLVEADQVRSRFTSCETTKSLVGNLSGAAVQHLGKRTASQIPQPTRSMVEKTKSGGMTPPLFNNGAVELYAVCSKRVVLADQKQRKTLEAKLRSKELARMRQRFLRDLRQDAFIEYR